MSGIGISDFPSTITDYIASNHSNATIVLAGTNENGKYGVIISTVIVLVFDASDEFLEEEEIGYSHMDECDEEDDD